MANAKTKFEGQRLLVLDREGWEFAERKKGKSAVAIIAMTDDRKLILTEQYRRPVERHVIDWPAGLVGDDGESDPEKTAKKELEEETGYTCDRVELLAHGPSSPGITSETVSLYRAYGVKKQGAGGGVGGERITVHEVALDEVRTWLETKSKTGAAIDLKIWGGMYFVTS
jgi:ADP-ribose pyrophosphatase